MATADYAEMLPALQLVQRRRVPTGKTHHKKYRSCNQTAKTKVFYNSRSLSFQYAIHSLITMKIPTLKAAISFERRLRILRRPTACGQCSSGACSNEAFSGCFEHTINNPPAFSLFQRANCNVSNLQEIPCPSCVDLIENNEISMITDKDCGPK